MGALQAVDRALGRALLFLLLVVRWIHATFVRPVGLWFNREVLPVYEESVKAVLRGWFAVGARYANTTSAVILALLPQRWLSSSSRTATPEHTEAWRRWWASAKGTFNYVLEREGLAGPATPRPASRASSEQLQGDSASENGEEVQQPGGRRRRQRWWQRRNGSRHRMEPHPASAAASPPPFDLQRGDALFELPSGFAIQEGLQRRGLVEECRLALELGVSRVFDAWRAAVRTLLFLGSPPEQDSPADLLAQHLKRDSSSQSISSRGEGQPAMSRFGSHKLRLPLESMGGARHWEDLHVWTASDVILRAGYPLEEHTVSTSDGYILQMHRIPRHGARDVAFFQHGVLDTSLGWVANGSVGSSAFAAFDAGFDVWLANSRSNAPRLHRDKRRMGSRYWHYTINQLAAYDVTAQINHIHQVKVAELQQGRPYAAAGQGPSAPSTGDAAAAAAAVSSPTAAAAGRRSLRRASTDSALADMRRVEVAGAVLEHGGPRQAEDQGADTPVGIAIPAQGARPLRRSVTASDPLQSVPGSTAGEEDVFGEAPSAEGVVQLANWQRGSSPEPAPSDSGGGGGGGNRIEQPSSSTGGGQEVLPYRLQAVGHSLGAACLIMYTVMSRMQGQPHRLRRLILMSPAGFHSHIPIAMRLMGVKYIIPALVWAVDKLLPGRSLGLRLPSPLLRYITFRFAQDLRTMPALHDLVRTFMRAALSGDNSQWDQALTMPHYNASSMPALSLHCGAHFAQWSRDLNFRLFDYGSTRANLRQYGSPRPPSIAEHYHLLDVPVDLVAGDADGVIAAQDVRRHYERMQDAGARVSFRVMSYGHMDFTFSAHSDEIREFVLSRLTRPL